MHEIVDDSALELTDFEYYAYRDETAQNPMVVVLRILIEGRLDWKTFRKSLDTALGHHPLLRSVVQQTGRRLRWKPLLDFHTPFRCTFHDGEYPPMECRPEKIDLKTQPGGRFELRMCPNRSVLIVTLHHACVDGIGGIQFLADVFALYGQTTAASTADRPTLRFPDPTVLHKRGLVPETSVRKKGWTEWLRGPSRFVFGKNYSIKCRNVRGTQPDDNANILHTAVLPRGVVRQLKKLAAKCQVSTNDLCMMAYLQLIAQWTQADRAAHDNDRLRILMPVSMRTPDHDNISAANVLSYAFQLFRRRDCRNPESLLAAIHRRSTEVIDTNEGAVLLRLFSLVRRIPGLFWLSRKLQQTFATAVLANVGELRRVFGNRFPLKNGRVVAGNVTIQRIDGIAPLRKNTNLAISFGGYGGELILNLRANPRIMSADEADAFLHQMMSRLSVLAETQSLTVDDEAPHGNGESLHRIVEHSKAA